MTTINKTKSVLIVTNGKDLTAKIVSDWANYYCKNLNLQFRCINSNTETVNYSQINLSNSELTQFIRFNNEQDVYKLDAIKSIYFRRSHLFFTNFTHLRSNALGLNNVKSQLSNYFMGYEANIKGFFHHSLNDLNKIGNDNGSFINKITVLKEAQKAGLLIPNTLLGSNKNQVLDFLKKEKEIITKSLALNLGFNDKQNKLNYSQYTVEIFQKDIENFPKTFPLTMFQQKIEKEFEIRTVYLRGKFYSCAMFTQNKTQTATDYRHYDRENPTRIVPFTLPLKIEQNITTLMNVLNLEVGSIDIMYASNKKYYFLEVNPGGQFSSNSNNCNFYLEREIAKQLTL